jgi:putative colanic acid biosynthesis UDP-glucose lipid carrier transferase
LQEFVVERVALFGDKSIAEELKNSFEREYQNLCHITVYEGGSGNKAGVQSGGDQLGQLIADGLNNKFDRIIICLLPNKIDHMKETVDAISFLTARIEAHIGHAELRAVQERMLAAPGQILIDIDDRPQDEWGRLVKRLIDLTLGSLFLVATAPVILLAAIAIKLESSGPVFFRQRRHGWNHSIISVWKLRTMTVQEDGEAIKQAVANDPRVTRVGRILRKTSIDELPQLFNVLSGEMSLVGPRPHALAHNLHYSQLIASYACRHKAKPGLTGWAQVKGLRGNSEDISKMVARAEADIWYVRNWSIMLDLRIILMTPFILFFQRNAL